MTATKFRSAVAKKPASKGAKSSRDPRVIVPHKSKRRFYGAGIPGVEVWQIGNEGGLLVEAVNLTADNKNQLLMSPAERAEVKRLSGRFGLWRAPLSARVFPWGTGGAEKE